MKLVALLLSLCAGCASSHEPVTTTTTPGDTCGVWQFTPDPVNTMRCGDGMTCFERMTEGYLADGSHYQLGICHPPDAQFCTTTACPNGWTCTDAYSGNGRGAPATLPQCLRVCGANEDCPGPFQVCNDGACHILACPMPGERDGGLDAFCPSNARCVDGLCVPR